MNNQSIEYRDLHSNLISFHEAIDYLSMIERNGDLRRYFKGANDGGRWFFQILSVEFVEQLARLINDACQNIEPFRPVLEIMSGDGQLAKFLAPLLNRNIIATDAKDGRYDIAYPKWVETMEAMDAVRRYDPAITLVSWEPFLSMTCIDLVEARRPLVWIGQEGKCGHPDLFEYDHIKINSNYALGKFDNFTLRMFHTDVYIFNVDGDLQISR